MNKIRSLKIFFDADALIAGSASQTGASFLLLQLSELKMIHGVTSRHVIEEYQRNLKSKLPDALPLFNRIIEVSIAIADNAAIATQNELKELAHPKDLPILAAAVEAKADYLVTLNTKHFQPHQDMPTQIITPGGLLSQIRGKLADL